MRLYKRDGHQAVTKKIDVSGSTVRKEKGMKRRTLSILLIVGLLASSCQGVFAGETGDDTTAMVYSEDASASEDWQELPADTEEVDSIEDVLLPETMPESEDPESVIFEVEEDNTSEFPEDAFIESDEEEDVLEESILEAADDSTEETVTDSSCKAAGKRKSLSEPYQYLLDQDRKEDSCDHIQNSGLRDIIGKEKVIVLCAECSHIEGREPVKEAVCRIEQSLDSHESEILILHDTEGAACDQVYDP